MVQRFEGLPIYEEALAAAPEATQEAVVAIPGRELSFAEQLAALQAQAFGNLGHTGLHDIFVAPWDGAELGKAAGVENKRIIMKNPENNILRNESIILNKDPENTKNIHNINSDDYGRKLPVKKNYEWPQPPRNPFDDGLIDY